MKKKNLILVGDGPFAEIAYEYFTYDSDYKVMAFSVEKKFAKSNAMLGLPCIPFEDLEHLISIQAHDIFVAIAYRELNGVRERLYTQAKMKGFRIASYVSSKAFVWKNVEMGENCFIFENNTVQPFVKIGHNVILWSGNHIGHHSVIRDNCFIASHVVVSGFCDIGENSILGVNATIANNVKVAKNCFIGAGALILKDTTEKAVYQGSGTTASTVDSFRLFKIANVRQ